MAALRHLLRKAMVAMNQVFNGILHTSHFPETWERVLLDMEKAFDKVWHNGLLHKLLDTPMPSALTRVITSFLHQCNFCVDVKEPHYVSFLETADVNVIVLDWRGIANSGYWTAVRGVPNVGEHLGDFLTWLVNLTGSNWNNIHLIGFSLGAHVVGNAGRRTGSRPTRITGLDPAGPEWGGNANALKSNDGAYVECIHTCGGRLGINDPICAANFYPNGGRHRQPGCGLLSYTCSHSRAYEYFAASVRFDHLVGRQCTNQSQANNNNCSGAAFNMGNSILYKRVSVLNYHHS
ncbi:Hepatic triacylglycerol lipase [Eumeta japonica]|uniref:Hepatic triacylglycerol lipase n=1 Tax=Eumeta variegata TaxID=151549 RepID=A0A4C1ZNM9_EUMVA|nr:Hepatic triacylglycerol lipase [Eumeta japonica]